MARTGLEDLLDGLHDARRTVAEATQAARVRHEGAQARPVDVLLDRGQEAVNDLAEESGANIRGES